MIFRYLLQTTGAYGMDQSVSLQSQAVKSQGCFCSLNSGHDTYFPCGEVLPNESPMAFQSETK